MTHNWLRYLVPREWTAEQALLVVELLGQARDVVWAVHGERMILAIDADPGRRDRLGDFIDLDEDEPEDDIPF
ncbi:MAG: hypothetical protein FJ102_24050 [Deltaproteobacteria bacterium]|nr:hypothetical protein [Deltaproteobacteria bacterium]